MEDATSRGRLDLAVRLGGNVYLFEFKVAERAERGSALAQLKERRYADKYRAPDRAVHLFGVEISSESRDVVVLGDRNARECAGALCDSLAPNGPSAPSCS